MPIDPRIPLEAGRGVLAPAQSFATTLRDLESVKAQRYLNQEREAQTKTRELQNQQMIRNAAEEAAMSAAMAAAGGDPTKAIEILRRGGHVRGAEVLEKVVIDRAKDRAESQKKTIDAHLEALKIQSQLASGITSQGSLDATRSLMMAMDKGMGPDSHMADALPKLYDDAGKAQVDAMVEAGTTSLERMRQKDAALKNFRESIQLQINVMNAQRAGNVSAEQIKNWQTQRRKLDIEGAAKLYASAKDDAEAQQIHDSMAPLYGVGVGGDPNDVSPLDMFSRDGHPSRQKARDYLTPPAAAAAGARADAAGARAQREQDWRFAGEPVTESGKKPVAGGPSAKKSTKGMTANQLMAEYRLDRDAFNRTHPAMTATERQNWKDDHNKEIEAAKKAGEPEPEPPAPDAFMGYQDWLRQRRADEARGGAPPAAAPKVSGLTATLPNGRVFKAKSKADLDGFLKDYDAQHKPAAAKPAAEAPAKAAPGTTAAPPPEPAAAAAAAAAGGTPPPNSTMRGGAPAQNQPTTAGQMYQMPKNQDLNEGTAPQEPEPTEEAGAGGDDAGFDAGDDGSRDIPSEPEPAPEDDEEE